MPVKTRKKDFRLTIAEDEAIKQNAQLREMPVATYLRARALYDERALRDDLQTLRSRVRDIRSQLQDIHAYLLPQQPIKKHRRNAEAKESIEFQS